MRGRATLKKKQLYLPRLCCFAASMSSSSSQRASVLVTGGAGFIGSHLVQRLLADGHRVLVLDDCSTGTLENLRDVRGHPRLQVIQSKISACAGLPDLVSQSESIFHLAAAVGVELVVNSPVHTLQTNLNETEMIIETASQSQ